MTSASVGSTPTLIERTSALGYAREISAVARQIAAASSQSAALDLLRQGTQALGAECSALFNFARDHRDISSCRVMLACDPAWGRGYLDGGLIAQDPWLRYAERHTEPIRINQTAVSSPDPTPRLGLAASGGFVSAVLVPAHSALGRSRVSLLCLGSSTPGYFDDHGFDDLRFGARSLALELHEWWIAQMRRELVARVRLTEEDLALLNHQYRGHGSKQIADDLKVSVCSINSRFQRLNLKLGVSNRRQAAQLAADSGLISDD